MTTLHYLRWDSPDETIRDRASDLFHEFHHDPPQTVTEDDFDELYAEVTTVDTDDLEQLFAEWNRGSGRESDRFEEMRYCERCDTYIEGHGEAVTHASQNHGYDPFHEEDAPAYVRGVRSLSVGDVVERDDAYHACAPIGWRELDVVEGDAGSI